MPPVVGAAFRVSHRNDVEILCPNPVGDEIRKAADFELARGRLATPWGTDLGMGLYQGYRFGHRSQQSITPSEPSRVFRRANSLRGLAHGKTEKVFP
jgi:hypothetical protein